jgi:hypothetical protein
MKKVDLTLTGFFGLMLGTCAVVGPALTVVPPVSEEYVASGQRDLLVAILAYPPQIVDLELLGWSDDSPW